jgi:hypothetical protein
MATDYIINVFLDDEKINKVKEAGLDDQVTEADGKKVIKVPLPDKNQRKFKKAFPQAVLNDQTGEVDNFPEDSADLLFDVVIENKNLDIMSFFLLKAFKPLAGKELRTSIH